MSLFVNQETNRSELQQRLAAELSEKAKKKKSDPASDQPDGVDDSVYMEGTKQTTSLAWVWVLIVAFAVIATIVYFIVRGVS